MPSYDETTSPTVGLLMNILNPITEGFEYLTENGAIALKELNFDILDSEYRLEFLHSTFASELQKRETEWSEILANFSIDIGKRISGTKNLKEFLKIIVDFYKFCSRKLDFENVIRIILKCEIFSLEELPEALKMSYDKIFSIACSKSVSNVAKALIINKKVKEGWIIEYVLEYWPFNDENFANELIQLIGEHYGTEVSSAYHTILFELAEGELERNK